MKITYSILVLTAALFMGCGADDGSGNGTTTSADGADGTDGTGEEIAAKGAWDDNYGTTTTVTADKWGTATIVEFNNEEAWAVVQLPEDDEFNPKKFSVYVWEHKDEMSGWWFCTASFGKDTAEDAKKAAVDMANTDDPAKGGCGDFPWTEMREPIEIKGSYTDNYDGKPEVGTFKWDTAAVIDSDNNENWAIVQLPKDDEFNPEKFSKYVWTEPGEDGTFFVCTVDFGKDSYDDAFNTDKKADDSDPAKSGCGDYAWTEFTPAQK